jgi:hypothetical protein
MQNGPDSESVPVSATLGQSDGADQTWGYVLMQFGHNDSKKSGHDGMWPAEDMAGEWALTHSDALTDYKWGLAINAGNSQARGHPCDSLPSPGEYVRRDAQSVPRRLPACAREAAAMAGVLSLTLYDMSVQAMNDWAPRCSPCLHGWHPHYFVRRLHPFALCGGRIRKGIPELARFLRQDASGFEVAPRLLIFLHSGHERVDASPGFGF